MIMFQRLQWILTGGKVSNFRWGFRTLIRIAGLTAGATPACMSCSTESEYKLWVKKDQQPI